MPELERQLHELGSELAFPPTPNLARAVAARIRPEPAWRRWRFAIAAAVALALVVAGSLAVSPDARRAVAGFLHLPGFEIRKVQTLPSPSPNPFTRAVTVAEARRLAGFKVLTPAAPEAVRAASFNADPPGGEVVLDLAGGAKVTEVKGGIDKGTFGKMVPAEGQVAEVNVNGTTGYWFKGLHFFFYRDASGQYRNEDLQLAADTLVFEKDGVLVRIEGAASEADAVRIAALLR